MVYQPVRASRSFAEHVGSYQERLDLLGQAEEPQPVARAQDRARGRMKHCFSADACQRYDGDPVTLADPGFAQRLVHEVSATEREFVEARQPSAVDFAAGVQNLHGAAIPVQVREDVEIRDAGGEIHGTGLPRLHELTLRGGDLVDQSLREARVRERHGVTVVALTRVSGETVLHPTAGTVLRAGDRLRLFGLPQQIEALLVGSDVLSE